MAAKPKAEVINEKVELPGTENINVIDDTVPPPVNFLPQKTRNEYLRNLNDLGYDTANLSDQELLNKHAEAFNKLNKELVSKTAATLNVQLEDYGNDPNNRITDIEFLERLYNMNVPKACVKLFTDADKKLTKEQIWEEIRFSGWKPYKSIQDLMKERAPRSEKRVRRRMKDFE